MAKRATRTPHRKSSGRSAPDVAVWIPRRETAELLQVAYSTMATWAGPRFRMKKAPAHNGTVRWYCHRDDVERVRLERLGPRLWELERHVLASLAENKPASSIILELEHVTLGDVERIRDHDARLSGACVLDPASVYELRQLLDVEVMSGATLVLHVRALVERVERLAGRLAMARQTRHSEPPPPKSANGG